MRVALIRHPEPLIAPGLCYGRLDIPLVPSAQARIHTIAANPDLRGAARIWTSPAQRCRVVAAAIAHALTLPFTIDNRLRELDFGAWEGREWAAIDRHDLDRWAASPLTFAPPGGESGAALAARIRAVHDTIRQAGQDCIVVSHGGPLKLLAALFRNEPPDLLAPPPPLGSLTQVRCGPEHPAAVSGQ